LQLKKKKNILLSILKRVVLLNIDQKPFERYFVCPIIWSTFIMHGFVFVALQPVQSSQHPALARSVSAKRASLPHPGADGRRRPSILPERSSSNQC